MSKRRKRQLEEWWVLVKEDPIKALEEFVKEVETTGDFEAAKQGRAMLAGDKSYWQEGSQTLEDAANFLITNSLMKAGGMGVIK